MYEMSLAGFRRGDEKERKWKVTDERPKWWKGPELKEERRGDEKGSWRAGERMHTTADWDRRHRSYFTLSV